MRDKAMPDHLGAFLTELANKLGTDKSRAFTPEAADIDLSSFEADVNRLYEYEGDELLYTGKTHPAPRLAQCQIDMIHVALTPAGVARWRTQ